MKDRHLPHIFFTNNLATVFFFLRPDIPEVSYFVMFSKLLL